MSLHEGKGHEKISFQFLKWLLETDSDCISCRNGLYFATRREIQRIDKIRLICFNLAELVLSIVSGSGRRNQLTTFRFSMQVRPVVYRSGFYLSRVYFLTLFSTFTVFEFEKSFTFSSFIIH